MWGTRPSSLPPIPIETWSSVAVARLALAILALAALLNLIERIIVAIKIPNSARLQADMDAEIEELKRQAKPLNTPDTFAQCAKLERKALALEKQATALRRAADQARGTLLLRIPGLMRLAGFIGVVALSWRVPAAVALAPGWGWPLGRWLGMGTGSPAVPGLVGLLPWTLLCHRATKALVGTQRG